MLRKQCFNVSAKKFGTRMETDEFQGKNGIRFENVNLVFETDWSSGFRRELQLCPALILASENSIGKAIKYIYSRLAASSVKIDQGIPDLVVSLIATTNNFDPSVRFHIFHDLKNYA